jgi:hypothetical protein
MTPAGKVDHAAAAAAVDSASMDGTANQGQQPGTLVS